MSYANDRAAELVGIEALDVQNGCATTRLMIGEQHLNGHDTLHGGILFLLADTAFAYACNSRGIATVASNCDITYHRPTYKGDVLTAVAVEKHLEGRKGIYDVVVTNQNNETVAHFHGYSVALR